MRIQVKLMSLLRNKLPPGSTGGTAQLDLEPGASVAALMEKLGIAPTSVHLVMVNGAMETDRGRALQEGDELVLFPPMAGGS
jgi:molybdopterin converting factor small subunit